MKKIKKELSSFRSDINNKLDKFLDGLSISATKQIIDALNNVINEFNKELVGQFGENFKELNNAVIDLVKCQQSYRNQLDVQINLFEQAVKSLSNAEKSITNIDNSTKSIHVNMQQLADVIQVNQNQINELENYLSIFIEIREKVVESMPETYNQIM